MYYGYAGKILQVNLLAEKVVKEELDLQFARKFIGGLGFNVKILYDEVGPRVNPFSPDNIVVISPGALTGTAAPTSPRVEVTTKSPLTGIIGTGNVGGYWGPALKHAGYDSVVIRGESEKPVYLWIDDNDVEIRKATHLWGKDSWDTTDILKEELGQNISVMSIGQAGENLVRFANVIVDYYHAPGRCHAGGVMGAKKLKAIAVRGTKKIAIKSLEEFKKAVRDAEDRIRSYPGWKIRERAGSMGITRPEYAEMAVKGGYLMRGREWCYCPCDMGALYGCNLIADIKTGKYAGTKMVSAAYTVYGNLGRRFGIPYTASVKVNELSNRYGMDCFGGGSVAFAMELYQRGIITKNDMDGLGLTRGNEDAIMEMLRKIAYREGLGDILAEGPVLASRKMGKGAEKCVIAIKGLEVEDGSEQWAREMGLQQHLAILTNPRGGDDLKATHAIFDFGGPNGLPKWARRLNWSESNYLRWLLDTLDMFEDVKNQIFGVPPRLDNLEGAMMTKWYNDLTSVYNSLGLCMFSGQSVIALGPTYYANLYSACTGWDITPLELMKKGEMIFNLMKAYNVREGLTREDDNWPASFYKKPFPRKEKIDQLLDKYYELRGWNKKTGIPTREKLIELQLDDVADELLKLGYLKN